MQAGLLSRKEPALPTPPISLPPSPSLSFKKPPLAPTSKGLNARAPSFSPSAFAPKPSTPVALPVQPTPRSSSSSQPLPTEHPALPVIQQPEAKKKRTPEASHPSIPAEARQNVRPAVVSQPVASTSALPAGRSSVIDTLAMRLMENLVRECLAFPIRNTAAEGLGQAHVEQRAMLDSERNRVVDVCAGGLLESAIDAYSQEGAKSLALECHCDRNRLRNSLNTWKRGLEKVRLAKIAKEKRKNNFQALSSRLGASPHKDSRDRSFVSAGSPEQSFVDLMPDPFVEDDETSKQVGNSIKSTQPVAVRTAAHRSPFWSPDTLSSFICDLTNKTFSTFRSTRPPDWKVFVIIPDLSGSMASWYRCKLGMQAMEDQKTDLMPYVQVEFVLITERDLHDEVNTSIVSLL